jgi:2-polyprenyl-6-hydroxyphenyl methylase/3-demethylubiquinone-9 3-methyltransferase
MISKRIVSAAISILVAGIGYYLTWLSPKNDLSIYTRADWWSPTSSFSILNRMNDVRVPFFITHLPINGSIADLGCGGGLVTEPVGLSGKYKSVQGFDINEASLEKAIGHLPSSAGSIVSYKLGSIYEIPLPSGSVDGVIVSDVFEHLDDLPKALREIHRILKPNGVVVFDTIARTWWSWLSTYFVAQEVLGIVQPGAHDWSMFINPEELENELIKAGFGTSRDQWLGIGANISPLNAWNRGSLYYLIESFFEDQADLSSSYMGFARKP